MIADIIIRAAAAPGARRAPPSTPMDPFPFYHALCVLLGVRNNMRNGGWCVSPLLLLTQHSGGVPLVLS